MRKTTTKLTSTKVSGRRLYCVTWPKIGRGRNRRHFTVKSDAKTFLDEKKIEQENYGTAGTSFDERQRAEYLECFEKLQPFNRTIRDAVNFYLPHLQATNRSCTASELVSELLSIKTADGASARYLSDLRSRLGQFSEQFDGKPVAEITATEVDQWLRSLSDDVGTPLAPTTRNNSRRVLIVAFNFARERGYCVGNPAASSAKAKEIEGTVGILSVEQIAALLEHSTPDILPLVAIGAFAGLRSAELNRLDWKEIDLQSGLIEVTALKAKSARRRFVKIQPNLMAWLKQSSQLSGSVAPVNCRKLLDAVCAAAGIVDWPHNALRHSFASYHLAHFNDAAALALEMGHKNSSLVFQHYRQLVKPKQAERYWSLAPVVDGKTLVAFTAAIS